MVSLQPVLAEKGRESIPQHPVRVHPGELRLRETAHPSVVVKVLPAIQRQRICPALDGIEQIRFNKTDEQADRGTKGQAAKVDVIEIRRSRRTAEVLAEGDRLLRGEHEGRTSNRAARFNGCGAEMVVPTQRPGV